jgi:hypothetical protein
LGALTCDRAATNPVTGDIQWQAVNDDVKSNSEVHVDQLDGDFDTINKKLTLDTRRNGTNARALEMIPSTTAAATVATTVSTSSIVRVANKSLTLTIVRNGCQLVGGLTVYDHNRHPLVQRQLLGEWSPLTLDYLYPPTPPLPPPSPLCQHARHGGDMGDTEESFICLTCYPGSRDTPKPTWLVCGVCIRSCHAGHNVELASTQTSRMGICTCGSDPHHTCRSMVATWLPRLYAGQLVPNDLRCTVAVARWSHQPMLQLMQCWQCLDCQAIPTYNHAKPVIPHRNQIPTSTICCKTCMLLCHSGHRVVVMEQGRPLFGMCQCQYPIAHGTRETCRARIFAQPVRPSKTLYETKLELLLKYNPLYLPIAPFDVKDSSSSTVTPVPAAPAPSLPVVAQPTPTSLESKSTPLSTPPLKLPTPLLPSGTHCYDAVDDSIITPIETSGAYSFTETGDLPPGKSVSSLYTTTNSLYDNIDTSTLSSSLYDTAQVVNAVQAASTSPSQSAYSIGADLLDAMKVSVASSSTLTPPTTPSLPVSVAAAVPTPAAVAPPSPALIPVNPTNVSGYSSPYSDPVPLSVDSSASIAAAPAPSASLSRGSSIEVKQNYAGGGSYASPYDGVQDGAASGVTSIDVPTPIPSLTATPVGSAYDTMATVAAVLDIKSGNGYDPYTGPVAVAVSDAEHKNVPVTATATTASVAAKLPYRDFNGEFQQALSLPTSTNEQRIVRLVAINRLTREFSQVASKIAVVIVEELYIPDDQRTYHPAKEVGGVAGGEKYIVDGIFIKFAKDWKNLYGGDQYAAKSASLELKGIKSYLSLNIEGLHAPLVVVIDYMGHRLTATSLLPLGKNSLVYGSGDGGETVQHSDARCNTLMARAGTLLNLKGHYVGNDRSELIYGPGDIEVHRGKDDRLYVIDAARTCPPEASRSTMPLLLVPYNDENAVQVTDAIRARVMLDTAKILQRPTSAMAVNGLFGIFQKDDGDPRNVLNKRASLLAGYQIKGDAIFIPNPRGAHLYNLLRPEFVRNYGRTRPALPQQSGVHQIVSIQDDASTYGTSYTDSTQLHRYYEFVNAAEQAPRTPLSSDAFTFFGQHDAAVHNREVSDATEHLLTRTLVTFARLVASKVKVPTSAVSLVRSMHDAGINVRYLGKVYTSIVIPSENSPIVT